MREARQRYESRLVEVDSGRKQEYESKLTEGLAEMRAQNEEQIRLYKDSMDSTYQTKVGALSPPPHSPLWGGGGGACVLLCSDYFVRTLRCSCDQQPSTFRDLLLPPHQMSLTHVIDHVSKHQDVTTVDDVNVKTLECEAEQQKQQKHHQLSDFLFFRKSDGSFPV